MDRTEFEVVLETVLDAVHEQYVMPLALALGTLTAAIADNDAVAKQVATALRSQAESCPADVKGAAILRGLADLAENPGPPGEPENVRRTVLQLIQGGAGKDLRHPGTKT